MHLRAFARPRFSRGSRLLTVLIGVLAFVLVAPAAANAATYSSTPDFQVKVNGIVYGAAHLADGRTVVGGSFTAIGSQARSNVGALNAKGYADPFVANTDGIVYAVAASTDGATIYLGGSFTQVNGVPRANLAAVDATSGAVLTGWQADTNGAVRALEVSGSELYVGGQFNTIKGEQRGRLVSLTTSAALDKSFTPRPNWTIRDIAVTEDGSKLYAVGGFSAIGGATRANGAAELTTNDGRATAFDPTVGGGVALAVDVTPDGSRMFFSTENNNVFAYQPGTGNSPVWTTKAGGDTQAIEATDSEVFIGGHFRNITTHRVKRNLLASLFVSDGKVTDWNPHLSGDMGPWTIVRTADKVVVGGDFSHVNQGARATGGVARFSLSAPTP